MRKGNLKTKINKIVAVLLATVMIAVGIEPVQSVKAAEKMNFIVKASSSTVSPGDTITVELSIPKGGNVQSFVGNLQYDTKTFDMVGKRGKIGPAGEEGNCYPDVDPGSISLLLTFDEPYNDGGVIYTVTLKVKEELEEGATGKIGFDFRGGEYGTDMKNPTVAKDSSSADVKVEDTEGKTLDNGKLTVNIPVESITLSKKDAFTMAKGTEETLTVSAEPKGSLEGKTIKWSTSDESVVKVDQAGKVEAVGKGTATVTAAVDGKTASVKITVNIPLQALTMNKTELTLRKGASEKLTVSFEPEDADEKTVTWTSSDSDVASVKDGKVTALKGGTTVITAKAGDKTATCTVKVEEVPLQSISLNQTSITIAKTETQTLNVVYAPVDTTDDKTVTWTSDDETVATVKDGVVTGIKAGTAKIIAKVGDKTAVCEVTVNAPLKGITIDPAELSVNKNQSKTITAGFVPADTTDEKTVTWSIDNPEIADIAADGVQLTVTGKKQGTAVITATTAAGLTCTCTVTVKEIQISSLKLNTTSSTLEAGETQQLSVEYLPADTTDDKVVTWSSSDSNVATVDEEGVVTAIAGGTAEITATAANGVTATCKVTVPIHLNGITLQTTTLQLAKGQSSDALTVNYDPVNTTDDKTVTWTSSDDSVATVENGVITGKKEGTATITAKVGNYTAVCEVTVSEIYLEGIKLAKDTPSVLYKGQQHRLSIELVPENTTDEVEFTYKSSNDSVATVDKDGTVTALKAGKTVITVTTSDGKYSASYMLDVQEIPLETIVFQKEITSLEEGQTAQLTVLYNPENTTDTKDIVWNSSDTTVATISADGLITALKAGTTTITAKVGDKTVSYVLTVTAKKTEDSNKGNISNGTKTKDVGKVKTGDVNHVLPVMLTLLLSLSMIVFVMRNDRKRRNK